MPLPESKYGSEAVTEGVRVSVTPIFLSEHSHPADGKWVWVYRVRIANEGVHAVTLVRRRWLVTDADGASHVVEGDGVVGQQPHIPPGERHEYESYLPLETPWGTMEGTYTMQRDDGSEFDAAIARFYLISPRETAAQSS
jgi:ApaG protein